MQLKHIPTGIVVKCQSTRSRSQNRLIARNRLAAQLDELNNGDASRAAKIVEAKLKKRASRARKARKKYGPVEGAKAEESQKQDGEAGAGEKPGGEA